MFVWGEGWAQLCVCMCVCLCVLCGGGRGQRGGRDATVSLHAVPGLAVCTAQHAHGSLLLPSALLQETGQYVGEVVDVISGTGTHDTLVLQLALNAQDISNSRTR